MRHGLCLHSPTRTTVDDDDDRDSGEEKITMVITTMMMTTMMMTTMMIDDDTQPTLQGSTLFAKLDENHFPVGEEVDGGARHVSSVHSPG